MQFKRAFSIIELLVVIGVLGIVLSLLLPALASSRAAARQAGSRANLYSLVQTLHHYTAASQDFFPINAPITPRPYGCAAIQITFGFWDIRYGWPSLLDDFALWRNNSSLYLSPGARRDDPNGCGWPTSYNYSFSFVARPELWRPGATRDESLLVGTRAAEVRAPAAKVILWDRELGYRNTTPRSVGPDLDEPAPMGFVDGHVDAREPSRAAAPFVTPFAEDGAGEARLHNTPDGVRGRDY